MSLTYTQYNFGGYLKTLQNEHPVKLLPYTSGKSQKYPVIIENRFLEYYNYGLNDKVLFTEESALEFVRGRINSSVFSGSVVYDSSILKTGGEKYLISENKLIYYLASPLDIEDGENQRTLNIDMTKGVFSEVKTLGANSIIINTAFEISNLNVKVVIILPAGLEGIERLAVQRVANTQIYLSGDCPQMFSSSNPVDFSKDNMPFSYQNNGYSMAIFYPSAKTDTYLVWIEVIKNLPSIYYNCSITSYNSTAQGRQSDVAA